jgi:hypothetical protein
MMALVMEMPAFFQHDLEELGEWWTIEKVHSWEGFNRLERMEEAERRFDVVTAMTDQYAWRVCILCRTYIDAIDQLHLNRPCGHQVTHRGHVRIVCSIMQKYAATVSRAVFEAVVSGHRHAGGGDPVPAGVRLPNDTLQGGRRRQAYAGHLVTVWYGGRRRGVQPDVPSRGFTASGEKLDATAVDQGEASEVPIPDEGVGGRLPPGLELDLGPVGVLGSGANGKEDIKGAKCNFGG